MPSITRFALIMLMPMCISCSALTTNTLATASANKFTNANPASLNPESWAQQTLNSSSTERLDWHKLAALRSNSQPTQTLSADPLAVEVSVRASVLPLNELLRALAQQLSVSLRLSEPLTQAVTWSSPNQVAKDVLNQMAIEFDLQWRLIGDVLEVKGPTPYTAFYPVDYLNIERQFASSVGLATEVGTMRGVQSSGNTRAQNSSSTIINNASEQAFWRSLQSDLDRWLAKLDGLVHWSINPDSGFITLHASPQAHRALKQYLQHVANSSRRQVLIEASVVEVLLSDEFEAGIDWQWLARGVNGVTAFQQLHGLGPLNADSANRLPTPSGLVTIAQQFQRGDFSATFQLLERFGDVRIVSRPQILAMNNQPAVLKVVDNRVYFTVDVERQQTGDSSERVTQTHIHTVPVGLVMNVTPHISAADDVMLNVRPSLSRILGFVNDPNPDLNIANVSNGVPEIQVREMESMLRVKSGSIAVIGGLMQSVQNNRDRSVPGLSAMRGIGALFRQKQRQSRRTELFIVLKPTVISTASSSQDSLSAW